MIDVAKEVRRCRASLGVSQDALAEIVGIGRGQISTYEKGVSCPSVYRFEDILNACGYELQIVERRKK